jgi:membrane protein implicated in regulation of membrane protease activity
MKISAKLLLRLHTGLAILWVCMLYPAVMWWHQSILFLAFTNIYAIIIAHASAHHSLLPDRQKRRRVISATSKRCLVKPKSRR